MDMDSEHIVLSRLLPKTGQTFSYEVGDDGDLEKGWWKGRTSANPRERFIVKTILGDKVVIDKATGLMWPAIGGNEGGNDGEATTWEYALEFANGLDFAGFEDWRLPNINELASIIDYGRYNPAANPVFEETRVDKGTWSSTVYHYNPPFSWYVDFKIGSVYHNWRTTYYYVRCVRTL